MLRLLRQLYVLHKQAAVISANIHPLRTTANTISVFGAFLCVLAGMYAVGHSSLLLVTILFLAGSSLDAIDGWVARKLNEVSPWGAYIDTLCDKVGEFFLLLGLAGRVNDPSTIRWLMFAAGAGLISSFQKSAIAEMGRPMPWPEVKILGRGLRVAIIGGGLLWCSFNGEQGLLTMAQTLTFVNVAVCLWRQKRIELKAYTERWNGLCSREGPLV